MSNAAVQIAMLYGRLARLNEYRVREEVIRSIEYYYKCLSDPNNANTAKTLIHNSKGTEDFNSLVNYIVSDWEEIEQEWKDESNFLMNVGIKDVCFST